MKTLYELIVSWRVAQQHKHDMPWGWADKEVNSLSNMELIEELTVALEAILLERIPSTKD